MKQPRATIVKIEKDWYALEVKAANGSVLHWKSYGRRRDALRALNRLTTALAAIQTVEYEDVSVDPVLADGSSFF